MEFEWNPEKALSNKRKHQVSFEEATSVFANRWAMIFSDERHSDNEGRDIIVGHSDRNRVLLVSFTRRLERIRIISARKATPKERRDYEEHSYRYN